MPITWDIEVRDVASNTTMRASIGKEDFAIGRTTGNDLVVPNGCVSRTHCRVRWQADHVVVEDLKSANGTFVGEAGAWRAVDVATACAPPLTIRLGADVLVRLSRSVEGGPVDAQATEGLSSSVVDSIQGLGRDAAILVLDLCSSTRLAYEDEKIAYHCKKRLEALARHPLRDCQASFIKNTGDGFLATFARPASALAAARAILAGLAQRNAATTNHPIHVRIALHWGRIYPTNGFARDIHGNDVNITFRLESLQAGAFAAPERPVPEQDRILCSGSFVESLGTVGAGADVVRLGRASLKGIADGVEVYLAT